MNLVSECSDIRAVSYWASVAVVGLVVAVVVAIVAAVVLQH